MFFVEKMAEGKFLVVGTDDKGQKFNFYTDNTVLGSENFMIKIERDAQETTEEDVSVEFDIEKDQVRISKNLYKKIYITLKPNQKVDLKVNGFRIQIEKKS